MSTDFRYEMTFAGFDIARVARFSARDRPRLLRNPGIIPKRLKIDAAIENAKRIRALGSFAEWLGCTVVKKTFVFTGGEITGSFLMSIGLLPGAHDRNCVYKKIVKLR